MRIKRMLTRTNHVVWSTVLRASALGLLLTCATSTLSQTTLRDYAGLGCMPIDEHKKSIYISYDDVKRDPASPSKDSEAKIWLRLHNNLTCGIRVPTATVSEVTLPSREVTNEILRDNEQASILYYLQDYKRKKLPKSASDFPGLDIVHWPILPAGRSVNFGVPLKHFRNKHNVVIRFVYTWEGFSSEALTHQVSFLYEMLPENVLK